MSFFRKAESCTELARKTDKESQQCVSIQEKDCCDNQSIVKEGDDTFKKSNTILELEIEAFVFLNTFVHSYINLFEGLDENVMPFRAYRPPLLSTDIIILNETFLI